MVGTPGERGVARSQELGLFVESCNQSEGHFQDVTPSPQVLFFLLSNLLSVYIIVNLTQNQWARGSMGKVVAGSGPEVQNRAGNGWGYI